MNSLLIKQLNAIRLNQCISFKNKHQAIVRKQIRVLNTFNNNNNNDKFKINYNNKGKIFNNDNNRNHRQSNNLGTTLSYKKYSTAGDKDDEKEEASFVEKAKGVPGAASPSTSLNDILFAGVGTFLGIGTLSMIHYGLATIDETMILGSFGATSVLIFGAPAAPFSQPRNVIGGHLVAAFCGVCAAQFIHIPFDMPQLAAPLAVSLACMSMMATRTVHPPAGGTALIAALGSTQLQEMGFYYLVPTAFGATSLVCLGVLINNLHPNRAYPNYWFK